MISLHYPYHSNEYSWNGIRVFPLNGKNSRIKKRFLLKATLERCLNEVNVSDPISIIHSFWLQEASVWSLSWAKKQGIPIIASAMGQDVLAENKYLRQLQQLQPNKIITLTRFHQQELLKSTGLISEVVGFGVEDLSVFEQKEKTVDIIGVGNLISLKNYPYFIEICALLKKTNPQLVVKLIGIGPEEHLLKQLITANGMTDSIELLGKIEYTETMKWIAKSKVLLHPSKFESFGMIFSEAKALQTHIASFSVGLAHDFELSTYLTGNCNQDANYIQDLLLNVRPTKEHIQCNLSKLLHIYSNPRER